jgi:ATP-dependent DNA helicase RecG
VSRSRVEWSIGPDTPVQYLRGVGEARAALLRAAGLETARDILYNFPFRYEDRRHPVTISQLRQVDQPVVLRGRIISAGAKVSPVRRLKIFEAILDDGTGTVMLVWFNQPYLAQTIERGVRLAIYGQPRISSRGRLQIEGPDYEILTGDGEVDDEGCVVPVYSAVSGISAKRVRSIAAQALEAVAAIDDPMPPEIREELGVIDLPTALVQLHRPEEIDGEFLAHRSPAHLRMILEEFFAFQLALRLRRAGEERRGKSRTIRVDDAIREQVRQILPFRLTAAQKRVVREIAADLCSDAPMYRLLQGDVGSGKTVVALIAALIVIANGHQAGLLAPTEILVEQHYQRIRQLVDDTVRVVKLTGSTPARERTALLRRIEQGEADLVVGTHALLEERVRFRSFSLAIVDEQHRFGVIQRQKLVGKGDVPDVLVMTATPIPRSLAITLYGDLDLSVIDQLPPGRQRVKTVVRGTGQSRRVYDFIEKELSSGAQTYVVFPLIEESEKLEVKALITGAEQIRAAFPRRRVDMLHGRMSGEEKEAVMRRFKEGRTDILVSTTVIEVGIDVANASVMLIFDADRFGLSQLHQLRGRVGRGERKSYCILLRDENAGEEAKERLRLFEATTDGFQVAERDLVLRGAGDVLGTRQSGAPRFRFGDIVRDHRLMDRARGAAIRYASEGGPTAAASLAASLLGRPLAAAGERD